MEILSPTNEIEMKAYEALKKVLDPEIGINIIDLGLVYKIAHSKEEGILVEMTFSTRACPMGESIVSNAENEIKSVLPNEKVNIQLVWEPEWNTAMISAEGKKILGME